MKKLHYKKAQALISLLVFSVVGIAIAGIATAITINSRSQNLLSYEAFKAEAAAQSGLEISMMAIIRNPSYAGETLSIDDTDVEIVVLGEETKNIFIFAKNSLSSFKIESQVKFEDNRLILLDKKTVY